MYKRMDQFMDNNQPIEFIHKDMAQNNTTTRRNDERAY